VYQKTEWNLIWFMNEPLIIYLFKKSKQM
jgi:hypothetical protein